jgi:predicted RND superfamily exporter protein
MTEKLYNLLNTVVSAVGVIATAFVTYYNPPMAVAIVTSIGIAVAAINKIMYQFIKE